MRAVNLIPADQRTGGSVGAGRSQGGAYAVLVLALGLALLAFLYGSAHHDVTSRTVQAATLTVQAQHAETAAEQLAPYTTFIAMRDQREQAVETLVGSRFDWAHVFHEFGRVLPASASISSLTGTVGSATTSVSSSSSAASAGKVASATPPGSVPSFTLTGCATSQPVVAQMLQRLRLIDGVSTVTLQSSTAGGGASGGSCPAGDPAFSAIITFDALPAASASASSSTRSVSDSTATAGSGSASPGPAALGVAR